MSNELVKFREVHLRVNGTTQETWTEYSVREVTLQLGALMFSGWTAWRKWGDIEKVDQNGTAL